MPAWRKASAISWACEGGNDRVVGALQEHERHLNLANTMGEALRHTGSEESSGAEQNRVVVRLRLNGWFLSA